MLSRKCAIDKVQGLNLEESVVNFRLQKQSTSTLQENERLCGNSVFENIQKIFVADATITTLLLNVRSF